MQECYGQTSQRSELSSTHGPVWSGFKSTDCGIEILQQVTSLTCQWHSRVWPQEIVCIWTCKLNKNHALFRENSSHQENRKKYKNHFQKIQLNEFDSSEVISTKVFIIILLHRIEKWFLTSPSIIMFLI